MQESVIWKTTNFSFHINLRTFYPETGKCSFLLKIPEWNYWHMYKNLSEKNAYIFLYQQCYYILQRPEYHKKLFSISLPFKTEWDLSKKYPTLKSEYFGTMTISKGSSVIPSIRFHSDTNIDYDDRLISILEQCKVALLEAYNFIDECEKYKDLEQHLDQMPNIMNEC